MDKEYRQIVENPQKANRYEKVHTLTVRQIQCKTKESYRSAHRIRKNVQLVPSIRKEQLKLQVSRTAGGAGSCFRHTLEDSTRDLARAHEGESVRVQRFRSEQTVREDTYEDVHRHTGNNRNIHQQGKG